MTTYQIIDQIWQLPFYKVAWIAFVDDMILFCKIWPLWLVLVAVIVICLVSCSIAAKND